jgi:hypothetical protein
VLPESASTTAVPDAKIRAALPDRKGISMARRSGQNGWIDVRNGIYYARFWIDVPGRSSRKCKRVPICPVQGSGSLNASERSRRLKQIVEEFGVNDEVAARATQAANLGITFQQQSELWLTSVQSRKRKPVKRRTAEAWKSHLKYINTKIGSMVLADVNNSSMREFVTEMARETKAGSPRFSPKSIESYLAVIKSVVASVRNEKGEPIYAVQWDSNTWTFPSSKSRTHLCSPPERSKRSSLRPKVRTGYCMRCWLLLVCESARHSRFRSRTFGIQFSA